MANSLIDRPPRKRLLNRLRQYLVQAYPDHIKNGRHLRYYGLDRDALLAHYWGQAKKKKLGPRTYGIRWNIYPKKPLKECIAPEEFLSLENIVVMPRYAPTVIRPTRSNVEAYKATLEAVCNRLIRAHLVTRVKFVEVRAFLVEKLVISLSFAPYQRETIAIVRKYMISRGFLVRAYMGYRSYMHTKLTVL